MGRQKITRSEGKQKITFASTLNNSSSEMLCHLSKRYLIKYDKNGNTLILLYLLRFTKTISRKMISKLESIESHCNVP